MEKPTTIELTGFARETGSKAAAEERSDARVPAVLYGPSVAENMHFSIDRLKLEKLLAVKNIQLVNITLESGTAFLCLVKKVDFHPVNDRPIHVDFYVLEPNTPVTLTVPIKLTGSARGVIEGGRLYQSLRELSVKCLPAAIPSFLPIDISKLRIGQVLRVKHLTLDGLAPQLSPERTIVMVRPAKGAAKVAVSEVEDEEETAGEAAEA